MTRPASKSLGYLYDRFVAGDPERVASYEEAIADAEVAGHVHDLRTESGLSRAELAARVGTTEAAIEAIEDADHDGHALAMLRRVAAAVGRRVEIRFPPAEEAATP